MVDDDGCKRTARDACKHQQFFNRAASHRRSGKIARPFKKRFMSTVKWIASFLLALSLYCVVAAQTGPKSLLRITSQADFDKISVTYDANTPYALPHVMLVIDRKDGNKVYYINKKRYSFHKDFVNGTYLSLERGPEFFKNNYLNANRRFILGTVAYQIPLKRWTFEFWEGDLIPADLIQVAYDVINKTFFAPVAFKPNS